MAQNIYSYIIQGILHGYRWILSLVVISTDTHKLASFDIPIRDSIHRYQCNNPVSSAHGPTVWAGLTCGLDQILEAGWSRLVYQAK